jgi:Protein of unknown function (DUF2892)
MEKNMGDTDRLIRSAIALTFVILFAKEIIPGTLGIILMIVAGIFLVTSVFSFCPLYLPFGFSSLRRRSSNRLRERETF